MFEKRADDEPLIRMAVASAATGLGARERLRLLVPLLEDPVLSVRQEAVDQLMDLPPYAMTGEQAALLADGIKEFIEVQRFGYDHPSARLILGYYYALRGKVRRAEDAYLGAISLEPGFAPAYVNLADLFRQTGRDSEGEVVLRAGLAEVDAAALLHAVGLHQVRSGRLDEALESLARAAALEESDPRMAYVYAVSLQSTGDLGKSLKVIDRALERHPFDRDLLMAAVSYLVEADRMIEAQSRADELLTLELGNAGIRGLLENLGLRAFLK